jgi:phospholipase/carboxylesterase
MSARVQIARKGSTSLIGLVVVAALGVSSFSAPGQTSNAEAATPFASGALVGKRFDIDDLAALYIPRSVSRDKPAPLLVVLHGGGRQPYRMINIFKPYAERHGFVLLAPMAKGATWDFILRPPNGGSGSDLMWRARMKDDPPRILEAIRKAGTFVAIDGKRSALIGISDGASYALTFGPDHPELFPTIVAYMPGMAFPNPAYKGAQRVFIAHGRQDRMLFFSYTAKTIVPRLKRAGLDVTFHPYDGGHTFPPASVTASGIAFILANNGN